MNCKPASDIIRLTNGCVMQEGSVQSQIAVSAPKVIQESTAKSPCAITKLHQRQEFVQIVVFVIVQTDLARAIMDMLVTTVNTRYAMTQPVQTTRSAPVEVNAQHQTLATVNWGTWEQLVNSVIATM